MITYRKFHHQIISPHFGLNRSPASQFIPRIRDYPPDLTDAVVVLSTASADISLVTRSKTPLSSSVPPDHITDVFVATEIEEARQARLPMPESLDDTSPIDTSPIGVAFDLSSKDKVKRPLPREEYEESPGPLPALMVLNNEGILATWWLVYSESIRQGKVLPSLIAVGGDLPDPSAQNQRQVSPFAQPAPATATFGQGSFGAPATSAGAFGTPASTQSGSAFGAPATSASAFGTPATAQSGSAFGATSTPSSAFGAPSGLGTRASTWGTPTSGTPGLNTASAFGKPAFGSSTPMGGQAAGSAFGAASNLGNRSSPWATPARAATATGSAFGQPSNLGPQASSTFGSPSTPGAFGRGAATQSPTVPASGGFASFANKPTSFASATPTSGNTQSLFGKATSDSPFAANATNTPFGQPEADAGTPKSLFGGGTGAGGFSLGSTFKPDGTASDDGPKPTGDTAGGMFGSNLGSALGAISQPKDEDMDEDGSGSAAPEPTSNDKTPTATSTAEPAPPKFQFPKVDMSKTGSLFGSQGPSRSPFAPPPGHNPAGFTFGQPTPIVTPAEQKPETPTKQPPPGIDTSPKVKEEPHSDEDDISPLNEEESRPPEGFEEPKEESVSQPKEALTPRTPSPSKSFPDPPLPPESTSKDSYAAGDSTSSSKSSEDAPLPPDFAPAKTKLQEVEAASPEQTELPEAPKSGENGFDEHPDQTELPEAPNSEENLFDEHPEQGGEVKVEEHDFEEHAEQEEGEVKVEEHEGSSPREELREIPDVQHFEAHDNLEETREFPDIHQFQPADHVEELGPVHEIVNSDEGDEAEEEGEVDETGSAHGEDESEGEEEEEPEPLDDEGSGIDVAQEISPSSSKESSKLTEGSSTGGLFSSGRGQMAFGNMPLFGDGGKPPVVLAPPSANQQESPRSPSPVRLTQPLDSLRPDPSRSMSAPGPVRGEIPKPMPSQMSFSTTQRHSADEERKKARERLLSERARREEFEHQPLIDDEDQETQALLNSKITGQRHIGKFLAHQDYVGTEDKPGVHGQIEKIYRDINSMIDTLGLNLREVKSFTKFHEEPEETKHQTREELEDLDNWCIVEVNDLESMEEDFLVDIEENKLQDVAGKISDIREIHAEVAHLRHQTDDFGQAVQIRKDPAAIEAAAQAPLSLDQQTQLRDLRKSFKQFQKQLADAEAGLTLLRSKIAFAQTQSDGAGVNGTARGKQPTVEAVENTIRKMTNMIERKSADIDILSSEMRRLRFSPSPSSSRQTPDVPTNGRSASNAPNSYSVSKKNRRSVERAGYRGSPLREQYSDGTGNDSPGMADRKEKLKRQKAIKQIVRDVFEQGAVKVRPLD